MKIIPLLLLSFIAMPSFADNSGSESMRLGQYDRAIENYELQLEDNPFNAKAANNLAVAYAMKRDYQEALEWLRRAAKMDRSRQDIALNLETLENWLAENGANANAMPVPPAVSGPLSPEPPAPW